MAMCMAQVGITTTSFTLHQGEYGVVAPRRTPCTAFGSPPYLHLDAT